MPGEPTDSAAREVLRNLRAQLEWQRDCGAVWLPRPPSSAAARSERAWRTDGEPVRGGATGGGAPAGGGGAVVRGPARSASTADLFAERGVREAATLDALRAHIGDCQRCKLAGGRTTLVFGVGKPDADLMFVGEGPGHDEDLQGEPFVGRAGQLLTEIISKGMKLRRQDVYIANVVKCRPPGNRNPEPDEITSCMPFLSRQIEIVQPRVIVALGTFAAQTLLEIKTPITRMRGTWQEYRGVKVMPTFHPAYLLRNPADKRLVWADIKLVMAELGLPV